MQTMNYKEAAKFLKITEGTLRNWVSKGRIKPHKVGKHVLFFREELETWITAPAVQPVPEKPAAPSKAKPAEPEPAQPSKWDARFQLSFSGKSDGAPFAHLENLPGAAAKMTPDDMRELARYLVDAAKLCEDQTYRGIKHHRIFRESTKSLSAVCLIPHDYMRDLKTLSQAAVRAGDPQAAPPEKYILRFIADGLRSQLSPINQRLKARGNRGITFITAG